MDFKDLMSNQIKVTWDEKLDSLLIDHADRNNPRALIQIRNETHDEMTFEEASNFIGQRLIMLIPGLRSKYESQFPFPFEE